MFVEDVRVADVMYVEVSVTSAASAGVVVTLEYLVAFLRPGGRLEVSGLLVHEVSLWIGLL